MAVNLKITIEGDKQLADAFGQFSNRVRDLRPYWGAVSGKFYESERQAFDSAGFGTWQALSSRYRIWKMKHFPSTNILEATGNLRRSLTSRSTSNSIYREAPLSLELGTTHKAARYHQSGTRRMPARPPLIITPELQAGIGEVIQLGLGRTAAGLGFQVR